MRLACFVLLVSVNASAAEYWFRPSGGSYGSEDGSDYANAKDGLSGVTATIGDNDTIHVCGTHREMLVIVEEGVTVDLACSANADPARLYGTDVDSGTGWTLVNGEYQKTFALSSGGPTVAVHDGEILELGTIGSLQTGQWACGPVAQQRAASNGVTSCYNATGSSDFTVYVKDDPTQGTWEFGARSFGILIGPTSDTTGVATITVNGGGTAKILYQGCAGTAATAGKYCNKPNGRGIAAYNDAYTRTNWDNGAWTINGVIFIGQGEQAIHLNGTDATTGTTPDRIDIIDSEFYNQGGEAIYLKAVGDGTDGIINVVGNTVGSSTYDQAGWGSEGVACSAFDGDGIDIGPGTTDTQTINVVGNSISHIRGNGISVAGGGAVRITDNTVNTINNRQDSCTKAAINVATLTAEDQAYSDNNLTPVYGDGFTVYGNANAGVDYVFTGNCMNIGSAYAGVRSMDANWARNFKFYGNRFLGGTYGIYWGNPAQNIDGNVINNNSFVGMTYPLYESQGTTQLSGNGNIFVDFTSFLVGNASYASVSALEAAQSSFTNNGAGQGIPYCGSTRAPPRRMRRQ